MRDLVPAPGFQLEQLKALIARPLTLRLSLTTGEPSEPEAGYEPVLLAGWTIDEANLKATSGPAVFTFHGAQLTVAASFITVDSSILYLPAELDGGPFTYYPPGGTLTVPGVTISVPRAA